MAVNVIQSPCPNASNGYPQRNGHHENHAAWARRHSVFIVFPSCLLVRNSAPFYTLAVVHIP